MCAIVLAILATSKKLHAVKMTGQKLACNKKICIAHKHTNISQIKI